MALLVGTALACAFFACIDIKTNATARQAYEKQLSSVYVDMEVKMGRIDSPQIIATNVWETVLQIEGISDAEIVSKATAVSVKLFGENGSVEYGAKVVAISGESHVYTGWLNRPTSGIAENETYIPEGSPLAKKVKVGDIVQTGFPFSTPEGKWIYIPLNLSVGGFAQLDDEAYSIASDDFPTSTTSSGIQTSQSQITESRFTVDLLLVGWETALKGVLATAHQLNYLSSPMETSLFIYLNRDALITPWDIDTSINRVGSVWRNVNQRILGTAGVPATDYLTGPLSSLRPAVINLRFSFIMISLAIFFIAWYMGTTVSDVSFNLRRRETGLLLTKGFSRGQISRIFLTETLLIGSLGGLLGLLSGFLLVRMSTQISMADLFNPYLVSPYTVIFTVIFGIIMAFLSSFSSARKFSQLPAVDALREYLPIEEAKPYRNRWLWVALVLGTYKLVIFSLGVNIFQELFRVNQIGQNLVLMVIIAIFAFLDLALNYVGPLLFFWGFTKLLIQTSLKFQELTTKAASFLGDLCVLATKNVRRNLARSAATAFLIALIIGYGTQVTLQLASEQDYTWRRANFQVGADIAVYAALANDAQQILTAILENVTQQIQNATMEYSFQATGPNGAGMDIHAIQPSLWPKIAFFESSWFSGSDATTAFNDLTYDRSTIILDKSVAQSYALGVGDSVNVRIGPTVRTLRIAGFFGPGLSTQSQSEGNSYWSFVSSDLYEELDSGTPSSAKILLKLKGNADGRIVAARIRNLEGSAVSSVESFAEKWEESQGDIITMASVDVQRLAVILAVVAASAGTALVSAVSMKERSREAIIMSVKGLSYKQLVIMFLTENLAVVLFSVATGLVVGLIVAYGNASALDSNLPFIIRHSLVFPFDATITLAVCIALIFISTMLPMLLMLRKYVTKLERVVRLR